MKTVILIRHAKTEEWSPEKNDFERRLKSRGKSDSKLIAELLKKEGIIPDHVISSPAHRAMETAEIFCEILDYPESAIQEEQDLYDGISTQSFLNLLAGIDQSKETVFVIGHNPNIYYLAANLVHQSIHEMPTCSTLIIQFDVNRWNQLAAREGDIINHFIPKNYR